MRTRVTVLSLSVCYQSPAFFSRLYDKLYLPACSSLDFLDFQLSEFDETVSFESAFHGYFVASSPDERLRILLVAITVTWIVTPTVPFLPTEQIRSVVNGAAALLVSGQATSRLTVEYRWHCYRSSCTFKETMSELIAVLAAVAII